MRELALQAAGGAMVALWIHGIWAYVQMVRHRRPGSSAFSVSWAPDRLTPAGLRYRRKVLWSWAAIAILLGSVLLAGTGSR